MTGKYQAYPEYKNSGVEWLGEIPFDWKISRIKFFSTLNPSKSQIKDISADLEVTFLPMEAIGEHGELDTSRVKPLKDVINGYTYIGEGDVCIAKITPCFENGKGAVVNGLKNDIAFATTEIIPFRCFQKGDSKYLYYMLTSEPFNKKAEGSMYGAGGQKRVSDNFVANYYFTLPSFKERQTIANFLDHETAKIDTLIEKQQLLIKLLKEKRQAVISHAVTKGLNPDAPMRDSGIEWLGEVPEHWIVRRLKHTSNLQSGIPKGKDITGKRSINVPMLRVANVQDGYLNLDDVHKMAIEPDQLKRFSLKDGDVLMNEGGDNDKLGRGAIWKSKFTPCIHQNHVFAIRPHSIEPEWLDLLTRASYAKFHFFRVAKQSTNLASISSTNIKETPLVIPPKIERHEIMDYVFKKIEAFEKGEKQCSSQIELLQERRTALISAAVTGKIDVRNWQAPEQNQPNMEGGL